MTASETQLNPSPRIPVLEDNDEGATAVEYSLLIGTIGIVLAVGALALGGDLSNFLVRVANYLTTLVP